MDAFNYPGCKLYDLLCRQHLLCDESAHNHTADLEHIGGLLHRDPKALLRWRAYRKAVAVTNMLHALFRPRISVAGAIAQPVQDRDDGAVCTDPSELANQRRYLF
jgi:hypothetical protein